MSLVLTMAMPPVSSASSRKVSVRLLSPTEAASGSWAPWYSALARPRTERPEASMA